MDLDYFSAAIFLAGITVTAIFSDHVWVDVGTFAVGALVAFGVVFLYGLLRERRRRGRVA